ncbi:hypothetical protein DICVIV_07031 [Dictyocaulus viviparus]|uniref:Uncharacterized protein n=1 Tax=Dictyocaulus viviparus TaxID=29172 RepID=A0A0D8XQW2_DICVI|nr:hypothetical protein DICVIV_07031 [Dictyocaulus viviparus]
MDSNREEFELSDEELMIHSLSITHETFTRKRKNDIDLSDNVNRYVFCSYSSVVPPQCPLNFVNISHNNERVQPGYAKCQN